MNILIVYATYSGSTMAASQYLQQVLEEKQHQVTLKTVLETQPTEFNDPDLIILASPSWDHSGEQGMPHEDYATLQQLAQGMTFAQKPFAVMGLGDSNYTYYCGAVEHLEQWIADLQGQLKIPSLKLDQYYFSEDERKAEIVAWADQL